MLCISTTSSTIIAHYPHLCFVHRGCFVDLSIKWTASWWQWRQQKVFGGCWAALVTIVRRFGGRGHGFDDCLVHKNNVDVSWVDTSDGYTKLFNLFFMCQLFVVSIAIISLFSFLCRLCTELYRNPQGSWDLRQLYSIFYLLDTYYWGYCAGSKSGRLGLIDYIIVMRLVDLRKSTSDGLSVTTAPIFDNEKHSRWSW
jgi:hypothetical protein